MCPVLHFNPVLFEWCALLILLFNPLLFGWYAVPMLHFTPLLFDWCDRPFSQRGPPGGHTRECQEPGPR